jgi:hypothetical protein
MTKEFEMNNDTMQKSRAPTVAAARRKSKQEKVSGKTLRVDDNNVEEDHGPSPFAAAATAALRRPSQAAQGRGQGAKGERKQRRRPVDRPATRATTRRSIAVARFPGY